MIFPNIFVDYPLGSKKVGDKLWANWNKAALRLWQTQLNFAVWCTSSACGVSSEHLNCAKHPMVKGVYRFHVYYHVRRVLKRLQVPLPHEDSFNAADNPYTKEDFLKFVRIMGYVMILLGIGMKNCIGLTSAALSGQMTTLVQTL